MYARQRPDSLSASSVWFDLPVSPRVTDMMSVDIPISPMRNVVPRDSQRYAAIREGNEISNSLL